EQGDPFVDPGATAFDFVDGDLTADIVVEGADDVDTGTLGTYLITYNVSDAAGNAADEVTRTVNVVPESPYLYRIDANGDADIDMGSEPPFLALPTGDLDAILAVTVTGSATLVGATTTNTFTNVPAGLPSEIFGAVIGTANTAGATQNWAFDVPNGTYEVRMYWGEHNTTAGTDPGDRLFDVFLEGN